MRSQGILLVGGVACLTALFLQLDNPSSRALADALASPAGDAGLRAKLAPMVDRAVGFLASAQAQDGSFSKQAGPGVTAVVASALLANGRTPSDPVVAKALAYIEKYIQPDGGVYPPESKVRNYETCLAILAFEAANGDKRYADKLKRAEEYVKKAQWDEGENADPSNVNYGGAGYGGKTGTRPDLSNTAFLADALKSLGNGPDDPAMQRMLVFVSRCQNLESASNDTKFPALNPDGGFYYTPSAGGVSEAGSLPNGGLRSYGSMTYAGLKSMIYCGVNRDDPRVKAAVAWAKSHYTLEENPGIGPAGRYYYLHTFAKAMDAMGDATVKDEAGALHNWRQELVDALAAGQKPNGSWVNPAERWMEGDPNLVTGYALLALSYCRGE